MNESKPNNDDTYKRMIKEYKFEKEKAQEAKNREYLAWKKILIYENEHFGTKHNIWNKN